MEISIEALEQAKAGLKRVEERAADYLGSNPNKYESQLGEARRKVSDIEAALKAGGVLEYTPQEKLNNALDSLYPNARSRMEVEYEGNKFVKRFFPAEKSRSGKTVYRWHTWWEKVADAR